MKIELTGEEAKTILQFVDIGLKQEGVRAIPAANMIIGKIAEAEKVESAEQSKTN